MVRGVLCTAHVFLKDDLDEKQIWAMYREAYKNEPFVRVLPPAPEEVLDAGFLSPTGCNKTNLIELMVFGNAKQALLVARLDNLGKGASGAAVQNMNLMLGFDETAGLID